MLTYKMCITPRCVHDQFSGGSLSFDMVFVRRDSEGLLLPMPRLRS